MVLEANFENSIIDYLVDELGYIREDSCKFNSDLMLFPSVVEDFIYNNHEKICKEIIQKRYQGDRKAFFKELIPELSEYVYNSANGAYNVAIQLSDKRNSFKFKGYDFSLFFAVTQEKNINRNIYSVLQQPTFNVQHLNGKNKLISDIGLFVNGFLFSHIQAKIAHRGQTAEKHGREQVIGDYVEAVKMAVVDTINANPDFYTNEEKNKLISKSLKCFHAPVSIVTMDMTSAYVMRGMSKFYNDVEKFCMTGNANDIQLKTDIRKSFLIDSAYVKEDYLQNNQLADNFLYNMYSKESIQNEILYFNFVAYEKKSEYKKGVKEVVNKNNAPTLNYPRPNQKYGVEKVIREIIKKYDNETNPDYEIERLLRKLDSLHVPANIRAQVIEKRMSYNNNKNQFSLLLQYAAGFGKTYILCWLALLLKDLYGNKKEGKTEYLFDKILIISDRVDLRDQVDRAMHNMNIEKELFKEADTKSTLSKFLREDSPRIIIVNIQKFTHLQELLGDDEKSLLNGKRVSFLIDEIHRSNAGSQHTSMTDLFSEVVNINDPRNDDKKNLIIGLTATPTDENLARFGEYQSCTDNLKWIPFDSFTMKEAIKDGFVLDPTKNLIPYAVKMKYEESDTKKLPSNKDIYENVERIKNNAKKIAEVLVDTTFKKIMGHGKGMLACYSIEAAKIYYDAIKEELNKLYKIPKYSNYKDTGVYMVYSENQGNTPAYSICGLSNEKEVINSFKNNRRGLMIVVDKLQTGFDEPKLHTLFLDKEISGISAVQTVCRVNRTTRGKDDCLVVDFSIDNRNISNIKSAFLQYSDIVVSDFDSYEIKKYIESTYNDIIKSNYYKTFFAAYKANPSNITIAYQIQQYIDNAFKNSISEDSAISFAEIILNYLNRLSIVRSIIDIGDIYKDRLLINFIIEYLNIVKLKVKKNNNTSPTDVINFWIEDFGQIDDSIFEIECQRKKKLVDNKLNKKELGFNVLKRIQEMNANEELKEELIEEFRKKIKVFFEKVIEMDEKKNDGLLLLKIKDNSANQTGNPLFTKCFKMALLRLKHSDYMKSVISIIESNELIVEGDFYDFITNEKK